MRDRVYLDGPADRRREIAENTPPHIMVLTPPTETTLVPSAGDVERVVDFEQHVYAHAGRTPFGTDLYVWRKP